MHFHSWHGFISEHLHLKSDDQSRRDEEKKAWIKAIMERNDRNELEDSDLDDDSDLEEDSD